MTFAPYIYIYIYIYIYVCVCGAKVTILAHEVKFMRLHNANLGRRGLRGDRVLCRVTYLKNVPSRHIRLSGRAFPPWLVNLASLVCVAWTGGPGVEFRHLHPVVVGSISSGGDHGMSCWWGIITVVPYVALRCLLDFLVMVIPINIYIYVYSSLDRVSFWTEWSYVDSV